MSFKNNSRLRNRYTNPVCKTQMSGKVCKNILCPYAHSEQEVPIQVCQFRYKHCLSDECPFFHKTGIQGLYLAKKGKPWIRRIYFPPLGKEMSFDKLSLEIASCDSLSNEEQVPRMTQKEYTRAVNAFVSLPAHFFASMWVVNQKIFITFGL